MKYYYLAKSGVDMIFIEVGDALISIVGYDTVRDDKYDFKNAKFVFFHREDVWKLGKLGQEIPKDTFWNFAEDAKWLKQTLTKTAAYNSLWKSPCLKTHHRTLRTRACTWYLLK